MVREEILRISRADFERRLTKTDISLILLNYCLDHNKPADTSQLFVAYLLGTPFVLSYFRHALEYYEKKFNINKVYSKPEIGDIEETRKLLFIY